MTQHIGEGTLDIPPRWHNASVNIYTAEPPGKTGPTISVNRDLLRPGMTLDSYTQEQLDKLRTKLHDFKIGENSRLEIDGRPAAFYEFTWEAPNKSLMHQLLLTVLDADRLINIVASHGTVMERSLRQQMKGSLLSFRFTRTIAS